MPNGAVHEAESGIAASIINIVPSTLWVLTVIVLLIIFRNQLKDALHNLTQRVASGSAVKIGFVEFQAFELRQEYFASDIVQPRDELISVLPASESAAFNLERELVYEKSRLVMLCHTTE